MEKENLVGTCGSFSLLSSQQKEIQKIWVKSKWRNIPRACVLHLGHFYIATISQNNFISLAGGYLQDDEQLGIQSEQQDSQGYKGRPCLKTTTTKYLLYLKYDFLSCLAQSGFTAHWPCSWQTSHGPGIIDIQGSVLQLSLYIPNGLDWPQSLNCSPWPLQSFTLQATKTQYNLEESCTLLEFNCRVEKQSWIRPDHDKFCVPTLRKTSRRFHLHDAGPLLVAVDYLA